MVRLMERPPGCQRCDAALESLYQEIILDHYRHPQHKGLREPYDAEVHHVNPLCGDEVTLRVTLKDGAGEPVVADVSYDALGCSISQASASVMSELIIGKTGRRGHGDRRRSSCASCSPRAEAEPDEDVLGDAVAFAGVAKYPARIKCALLGWMAWKDATAQALEDEQRRMTETTVRADGDTDDRVMPETEDLLEALRDVVDPELGVNVVDLGLVYGVTLASDKVLTIDMTLTSAACPLTDVIEDQARSALEGLVSRLPDQLGLAAAVGPGQDHRGRPRAAARPRLQRLIPQSTPNAYRPAFQRPARS